MVAVDRKVQLCFFFKFNSIVDRWVLLLGGCCRRISIVVSLVVW